MPARTLTRRESKELTRRRLIDGAIDLIRAEGLAAATTGRIARAAGIRQSSFYGHFPDRDACLEAAADQIGSTVLEKVRRQHARFDAGDLRASVRRGFGSALAAFTSEPELGRLFLRHVADDESPMGRAFRRIVDRARLDLKEAFRRFGIDLAAEDAQVFAELLINATFGLADALLHERVRDRDAALDGVTMVTLAALRAVVERKEAS